MILYVNGDSHSAGAEAVNSYAFANDDTNYSYLGRLPHPDNIIVSYGNLLAKNLNAEFYCDAESASSNSRILRTTRKYLEENTPNLVVIGWSTWEREEWLHDGIYWQISAGGVGHDWPQEIQERYYQWVMEVDYNLKVSEAHQDIHQLHLELQTRSIPHLFFNTYAPFNTPQLEWNNCYIGPYDPNLTYYHWLKDRGVVPNESYHYSKDAHLIWANHLTNIIKESIMTT